MTKLCKQISVLTLCLGPSNVCLIFTDFRLNSMAGLKSTICSRVMKSCILAICMMETKSQHLEESILFPIFWTIYRDILLLTYYFLWHQLVDTHPPTHTHKKKYVNIDLLVGFIA